MMLGLVVLGGCSAKSESKFSEADEVARAYFEAFVNKDHDGMMEHFTEEEKQYVLKNEFMEEGKVEFPGNFDELGDEYMLAGYSKYFEAEDTLLYWGKYKSPKENGEERNMWLMLVKDGENWRVPEWKLRNETIKKEIYDGVNNKDEEAYFLQTTQK